MSQPFATVTIPLDEDQARLVRDYFDLVSAGSAAVTPALFVQVHLTTALLNGVALGIRQERGEAGVIAAAMAEQRRAG